MPYVNSESRDRFRVALNSVRAAIGAACTPGDLNYVLTKVALAYVEARGENYTHINDVLGALEGAKQEFYRRVAVPYENQKIVENGDVYL